MVLTKALHRHDLRSKNTRHIHLIQALLLCLHTIIKIQVIPCHQMHGIPMNHYVPACFPKSPALSSREKHPKSMDLLNSCRRENVRIWASYLTSFSLNPGDCRWAGFYKWV